MTLENKEIFAKKVFSKNVNAKTFQKIKRLTQLNYEEKVIQIKRVTKVVKGGKKMTFQALVIVGDKKQRVGIGIGHADDINKAIEKATLYGKRKSVKVPLTIRFSIPHLISSLYGASSLLLRPASQGTGIIASGTIRTVLELGGIKNIVAKQFGSKNILNNAKATILALVKLRRRIILGKALSLRKNALYKKIMKKRKYVYPSIKNY